MIFNKDLAFGYVASLYSIYVLAGCKQCDEMKNFNKKNIRKNASFLIRNCQFRLRFDWPQHIYKLIKYYIDRLDTVTRILKEKRPRNFEYYIDHVRLNWCDVFFLSFMPNVGIRINSWRLNKAIIVIFDFNDYYFVIY